MSIIKYKNQDGVWEEINGLGGNGSSSYKLPQASANVLGGIKASPKSSGDTVECKIGTDGKMYVPTYTTVDINLSPDKCVYFSTSDGDDTNDGASPQAPKKSVKTFLESSDSNNKTILLKSGDVFQEWVVLRNKSNVRISSYGGLNKPKINGLRELTYVSSSNNIHTYTAPYEYVGHLVIDGERSFKCVDEETSLLNDDEYFVSGTTVKVRRTTQPTTVLGTFGTGIMIRDSENIRIDGIEVYDVGVHGIGTESNVSNLVIENCHVHHIGGSAIITNVKTVRLGNGIQFWSNNNNNIVCRYNRVEYVFDSGITPQITDSSTGVSDTIIMENNWVSNCWNCFEFANHRAHYANKNIIFRNNYCTDQCDITNGYRGQASVRLGSFFCLWNAACPDDSIYVIGNIGIRSSLYAVGFDEDRRDRFFLQDNAFVIRGTTKIKNDTYFTDLGGNVTCGSDDVPTSDNDLAQSGYYSARGLEKVSGVSGSGENIVINNSNDITLPVASSTTLGGVKGAAKTSNDTVPVHIDNDGYMYVPAYPTTSNGSSTEGSSSSNTSTFTNILPVNNITTVEASGYSYGVENGCLFVSGSVPANTEINFTNAVSASVLSALTAGTYYMRYKDINGNIPANTQLKIYYTGADIVALTNKDVVQPVTFTTTATRLKLMFSVNTLTDIKIKLEMAKEDFTGMTNITEVSTDNNTTSSSNIPYVTPEDYGAKGDGATNDFLAIQDAYNSGYDVHFTGGKTYMVDAQDGALNGRKYINVTRNTYGNGATLKSLNNSHVFVIQDLTNITVQDLTFEGNLEYGDAQDGIHLLDIFRCDGIRILNVTTKNNAYSGSRFFDSKNIYYDNYYNDSTDCAIIALGDTSENVFITNFRIIGNQNRMSEPISAYSKSNRNWVISNGYIAQKDTNGICLGESHATGGPITSSGFTISNVVIENCKGGIYSYDSEFITVTNCVFKDIRNVGVYLNRKSTISNCIFDGVGHTDTFGSGQNGTFDSGCIGGVYDSVITGNTFITDCINPGLKRGINANDGNYIANNKIVFTNTTGTTGWDYELGNNNILYIGDVSGILKINGTGNKIHVETKFNVRSQIPDDNSIIGGSAWIEGGLSTLKNGYCQNMTYFLSGSTFNFNLDSIASVGSTLEINIVTPNSVTLTKDATNVIWNADGTETVTGSKKFTFVSNGYGQWVETTTDLSTLSSSGTGISSDVATALLNCFKEVAWKDNSNKDVYNALATALGQPTI